MRLERAVNFRRYRIGHAGMADLHPGFKGIARGP
jgi:hypothetical protein